MSVVSSLLGGGGGGGGRRRRRRRQRRADARERAAQETRQESYASEAGLPSNPQARGEQFQEGAYTGFQGVGDEGRLLSEEGRRRFQEYASRLEPSRAFLEGEAVPTAERYAQAAGQARADAAAAIAQAEAARGRQERALGVDPSSPAAGAGRLGFGLGAAQLSAGAANRGRQQVLDRATQIASALPSTYAGLSGLPQTQLGLQGQTAGAQGITGLASQSLQQSEAERERRAAEERARISAEAQVDAARYGSSLPGAASGFFGEALGNLGLLARGGKVGLEPSEARLGLRGGPVRDGELDTDERGDRIPASLSPDEYVIPAMEAKRIGHGQLDWLVDELKKGNRVEMRAKPGSPLRVAGEEPKALGLKGGEQMSPPPSQPASPRRASSGGVGSTILEKLPPLPARGGGNVPPSPPAPQMLSMLPPDQQARVIEQGMRMAEWAETNMPGAMEQLRKESPIPLATLGWNAAMGGAADGGMATRIVHSAGGGVAVDPELTALVRSLRPDQLGYIGREETRPVNAFLGGIVGGLLGSGGGGGGSSPTAQQIADAYQYEPQPIDTTFGLAGVRKGGRVQAQQGGASRNYFDPRLGSFLPARRDLLPATGGQSTSSAPPVIPIPGGRGAPADYAAAIQQWTNDPRAALEDALRSEWQAEVNNMWVGRGTAPPSTPDDRGQPRAPTTNFGLRGDR